MLKQRIPYLLFIALLCLASYSSAQTDEPSQPAGGEDKIGGGISDVVASYPYRLGIFRVLPRLIVGTSYDSNVFSTSEIELSDYFTAISPGGSFGLKLGRRAYLVLNEDLNILIYQNQSQLNDVFNTTSARLGIGSRRLLLELGGTYYKSKSRFDPEFDQPVQRRHASADANLSFAVRRGTDLNFNLGSADNNYERVNDVVLELPVPPDTRSFQYSAGIDQDITSQTSVSFDGTKGYTDFTNLNDPEISDHRSNFWRILGGFNFRGNRIVGRAKAGLEERQEIRIELQKFRAFYVDVNVDYALAKRLAVGGYIIRQLRASALLKDEFRLLVEVGARGCVPVARAFFLDGKIGFGKNDYGNAVTDSGEVITQDDFRRYEAGANFVLPKNFVVRVGTTYTDRISNISRLNKNRFLFNVGIAFEASRGITRRHASGCGPVSMNY